MTNLVYYTSVSRGSIILADHKKPREELTEVAVECLEKVPLYHAQFTYTIKQRMFIFLIDGAFTYFAIVDEAVGKLKAVQFLEHVRNEFKLLLRSRGLDGYRLERNSLVHDFSGTLKAISHFFLTGCFSWLQDYSRIDFWWPFLVLILLHGFCAGVLKQLVKPMVGIPQKEVDMDKDYDLDSKDDTSLSPPRDGHSGPLTANGGHHHPKQSTKQQQVRMPSFVYQFSCKVNPLKSSCIFSSFEIVQLLRVILCSLFMVRRI